MADLRTGWAVLGNDGGRVGTVKDVGRNYILISRPGFSADWFVPVSSIANVENEVVHLNITQPDAKQMGWEQEPRDDGMLETSPDSDLHRHVFDLLRPGDVARARPSMHPRSAAQARNPSVSSLPRSTRR